MININWPEVIAGAFIFCGIVSVLLYIFADILLRLSQKPKNPKTRREPKPIQPIQGPPMFNPYHGPQGQQLPPQINMGQPPPYPQNQRNNFL